MNTKIFLRTAVLLLGGIASLGLAQNAPSAPDLAAMEARAPDRTIYLGSLPAPADLSRDAAANHVTIARIDQTQRSVVVYYRAADGTVTKDDFELLSSPGVPMAPSVPNAPQVAMAPSVPSAPSVPAAGAPDAPVVSTAAPAYATYPTTVVVPTTSAPPAVYYQYPAATTYYDYPAAYGYYPYYYGYPYAGWYAPFGVSLNLGWRGGVWRGGGFRGGFHR